MSEAQRAKPRAAMEQRVGRTAPTGWSHHPGGLEWLGAAAETKQ